MKKAQELKDLRAAKTAEGSALLTKAKTENREFTSEEQTQFDAINAEIRSLDSQVDKAVERETFEARMAGASGVKIGEPEKKELRDFSFTKFVKGVAKRNLDGFELEMHQEAEKEMRDSGIAIPSDAFHMPKMVLDNVRGVNNGKVEKRDMTASGSFAIATEKYGFFEAVRDRQVLSGLGAQYLLGLQANIDMPGFTAGATAVWAGENADSTESDQTIGGPGPRPNRLTAFTNVSWLLKTQAANVSIEQMIINDLLAAAAMAWQKAAINGSGSSNQPQGLLGLSGVNAITPSTNGDAPTLAILTKLEGLVETSNTNFGSLGYLTNGKVRATLKNTFPNSVGNAPVWPLSGGNNAELNGYPSAVTNSVPYNLTQGSASGVCSAILYGNWSDLIMAQYGGLTVTFDPYTKAINAEDQLILNMYVDCVARRPKSFAYHKAILAAL